MTEKTAENAKEEFTPGTMGFILGLIFGGGFGFIATLLSGLDIITGLLMGIGGGIIIGSIIGLALERRWVGTNDKLIIPFGLGWGTVVGILLGVVTSWIHNLAYLSGFSVGSITGLVAGTFLGTLLYLSSKKD
ncbi:MAG: hypothetical protein R6U96_05495 [Promethearchaeia archaeon]